MSKVAEESYIGAKESVELCAWINQDSQFAVVFVCLLGNPLGRHKSTTVWLLRILVFGKGIYVG